MNKDDPEHGKGNVETCIGITDNAFGLYVRGTPKLPRMLVTTEAKYVI